ncbi:MAG: phosphate acyltransferase PlsX [Ruminococcus sp.]|nr:phosphate acyltransferase PlsX [Ruminococcus sp.]MBQ8906672.1 phosphate acyltransferase PlsX [Ruminococcus sp.]
MNIIVDAFGGDHAPQAVILGAVRAAKELNVNITLTGDEDEIHRVAEAAGVSLDGIEVLHTTDVISMHDEPTSVLKEHKDCSMAVGLRALRDDKGDAFVSAGSTGALVVGATFLTKRIRGIKRAALAPILPTAKGHTMLIDGGGNIDVRPEMLVQFALMGSAYMSGVMGVNQPNVGLVNVGSERTKGRELELETYARLEKAPIRFGGNMEAREFPSGDYDVVVTDGFTGNVILKLYEGLGSFFAGEIKGMFSDTKGKLAGALVLGKIKDFKKRMDYKEVGGAVLLGISKPVIKAHGSSDETAIFNAIRQAKRCVSGQVVERIETALSELKGEKNENAEREES